MVFPVGCQTLYGRPTDGGSVRLIGTGDLAIPVRSGSRRKR